MVNFARYTTKRQSLSFQKLPASVAGETMRGEDFSPLAWAKSGSRDNVSLPTLEGKRATRNKSFVFLQRSGRKSREDVSAEDLTFSCLGEY